MPRITTAFRARGRFACLFMRCDPRPNACPFDPEPAATAHLFSENRCAVAAGSGLNGQAFGRGSHLMKRQANRPLARKAVVILGILLAARGVAAGSDKPERSLKERVPEIQGLIGDEYSHL